MIKPAAGRMIGAGVALSTLVFARVVSVDAIEGLPDLCLVKAMTGLDCWGCGLTRGLSALLHADPKGAAAFNGGTFVLAPLLVILSLRPLSRRW